MSTDTIRERATALCNYIQGNGGFGYQAHALANDLLVALSAPAAANSVEQTADAILADLRKSPSLPSPCDMRTSIVATLTRISQGKP